MKLLKFIILCLCLLLIFAGHSIAKEKTEFKFTVLGGLDVLGEGDQESEYIELDGSDDVNTGITIGVESAMQLENNFNVGLGFRYMLPRETDNDDAPVEISGIITYLLFQLNIPADGEVKPYLVGHIGYNIPILNTSEAEEYLEEETPVVNPSFDATGGLYFGFGAGLYFTEQVGLQLLYGISYSETQFTSDNFTSDDMDNEYSRLTIAVTYTFN